MEQLSRAYLLEKQRLVKEACAKYDDACRQFSQAYGHKREDAEKWVSAYREYSATIREHGYSTTSSEMMIAEAAYHCLSLRIPHEAEAGTGAETGTASVTTVDAVQATQDGSECV